MLVLTKSVSNLKTRNVNGVCCNCLKHSLVKKAPSAEKKTYKSTIFLPKTDFPLWLTGTRRIELDEKIIKECGFTNLYNWQRNHVTGSEFVLHDGPPYANGLPHMGHAVNKVLKDITTRHKLLQGHRIHYKPGWDCHGLPIELKAMAGVNVRTLTPLEIRSKARKFAEEAIRDQKAMFRSWGVMADWDNGCYFTFDKSYVKNQLQQFYKLYKQGFVYRDVKPVFWSPSSRTALAEAELEYREDHESVSLYVRVRVSDAPPEWGDVYALIWTTTPWTLPANVAVAFKSSLAYCLVTLEGKKKERYIVASALVDQLTTALNQVVKVTHDIDGSVLSGLHYQHPLDNTHTLPFIVSDHITPDKGTGLVHVAPAHGPDDFKLAKKFNLPVPCLVDEEGYFTEEAGLELSGISALTMGMWRVVKMCRERGVLVHVNPFKHAYPYDWRTGLPVILRASQQWFFDTSVVKEKSLAALRTVKVLPEKVVGGLVSQVQTRPFWCISRQRVWGVPVPVLYTSSGQSVISQELVDHYCHLLDSVGNDFWWSCTLSDLAPSNLLASMGVDSKEIERSQDILDIWLDSGLSWSAVLDTPVADLYLEGVDQFNGWFQSSLMTSVALQQVPPYKTVFVHGFAVDEYGTKMSKSLGNVVNPQDIVYGGKNLNAQPTYGVDVLRWWVAAHATQQTNVPVSPTTLADSKDCVHKLRSVMKFLLGALHGYLPQEQAPPLLWLDRYMLHSLHMLEIKVMEQYNQFQYNRVCTTLINFVVNQLSAFYCHIIKDRLYCSGEDCEEYLAAKFTLYHTTVTLARLLAPVIPLLAEEVHSYLPVKEEECLFHSVGPATQPEWQDTEAEAVIQLALDVKQQIRRLSPLNCSNWELSSHICAPQPQWQRLKVLQSEEESSDSELAEVMQVSRVRLSAAENPEAKLQVEVGVVGTSRCERCRRHTAPSPDLLCPRCERVVATLS